MFLHKYGKLFYARMLRYNVYLLLQVLLVHLTPLTPLLPCLLTLWS